MGRTIKLLLYFFAYQLAFMGVTICGYMLYQGSYEVPQTPDSLYTNLIMLAHGPTTLMSWPTYLTTCRKRSK